MHRRGRDRRRYVIDLGAFFGIERGDGLAFALPQPRFVIAAVEPEDRKLTGNDAVDAAAVHQAADLLREFFDVVEHPLMSEDARKTDVVEERAFVARRRNAAFPF